MKIVFRMILAVVLSVGGVTAMAAAPAAAAYATPGYVLTSTTASLPSELSAVATGKKISYVTTSITGATITATGLVLTPKTGKNNKIVAWGHGTTGLADGCAPSTNQAVFWAEARIAVAELISRGWTVTAPDYPGLGTPQAHPYLIGNSEARSLIDGVKAARNLDSSLGVNYAIDGHSQGGQGSLFANQLAPSYDGNLVLKGTAAIAPVSNADVISPLIPGSEANGYLVMAMFGIAAVDSSFNPLTVLAAPAEAKLSVLATGCLNEILAAYADLSDTELVEGGTLPDSLLTKLATYDNPAQTAPSAPILVVQGTEDEAVPYFVTADLLIPQLEAYSQPVDFVVIDGASHDEAVIQSADLVADWIAARFA
ncbi:alpha/beta fold hydrolase [Actinoplanes sp. NPDC051851]|uniref:alpha/beta fold hydrolase n=1 Tax=Actinoplanes sp. NPDC051851 TaxID=3154753 RepID=UPI00342F984F